MSTSVFQSKLSVHINCRTHSIQRPGKKNHLIKRTSSKILSCSKAVAGLLTSATQRYSKLSALHKTNSSCIEKIRQSVNTLLAAQIGEISKYPPSLPLVLVFILVLVEKGMQKLSVSIRSR